MSNLFVKEDEDDEMDPSPSYPHTQQQSADTTINETHIDKNINQDLDDPVIKEVPIILKATQPSQRILLLQYPGRPTSRPFTEQNRVIESREKLSTNVIEVDVPIDTSKFYDSSKEENWGVVNKQTLRGVLTDSDGYYVASVQNGELVLVPVDKCAQMRPAFNYIDKDVAEKMELTRLETRNTNGNGSSSGASSGVQVVQMTVKSTNDTAPRLGGALLARKKADEEDFTHMNWNDLQDEYTKDVRTSALTVENKNELKSTTTNEEYINMLVRETMVE